MNKNTILALCLTAAFSGGFFFQVSGMEAESRPTESTGAHFDPFLFAQNNSRWNLVFEYNDPENKKVTVTIAPGATEPIGRISTLKFLKYHGGTGASVRSWVPNIAPKLQENKDLLIKIGTTRFGNWTEDTELLELPGPATPMKEEQPQPEQAKEEETKEESQLEEPPAPPKKEAPKLTPEQRTEGMAKLSAMKAPVEQPTIEQSVVESEEAPPLTFRQRVEGLGKILTFRKQPPTTAHYVIEQSSSPQP